MKESGEGYIEDLEGGKEREKCHYIIISNSYFKDNCKCKKKKKESNQIKFTVLQTKRLIQVSLSPCEYCYHKEKRLGRPSREYIEPRQPLYLQLSPSSRLLLPLSFRLASYK